MGSIYNASAITLPSLVFRLPSASGPILWGWDRGGGGNGDRVHLFISFDAFYSVEETIFKIVLFLAFNRLSFQIVR